MHTDRQSSVVAISDSAGNVTSRRGYGTYGETEPTQMTGTTSAGSGAHPFGYTGRRWDPDLGLYYYRARWYDPALGTFLQTDPIGSLDYVNLYSYVGAEPGNATDPSGRVGLTVAGAGVGCAVTGPACPAGAAVGAAIGTTITAAVAVGVVFNEAKNAIDREQKSNAGKEVVTQGKRPRRGERQIGNRGEGRSVNDVLDQAAAAAEVEVTRTKDGKPHVVLPNGTTLTGRPTSTNDPAPTIDIRTRGGKTTKTREDRY